MPWKFERIFDSDQVDVVCSADLTPHAADQMLQLIGVKLSERSMFSQVNSELWFYYISGRDPTVETLEKYSDLRKINSWDDEVW